MDTCNYLLANLGYECQQISDDVSQLITPFTKGNDGELIGVYVQSFDGRYRISDGGDSLSHMLTHNVKLNKKRLDTIERKGLVEGVELTDLGEICTSTGVDGLTDAVNRVLSVCLEASTLESQWLGSMRAKDFTTQVGEFLQQTYERVDRSPLVRAVSGHQIEIAFGVHGKSGISYVQPVAPRAGRLNWGNVYKVSGMMNDLREISQRRFVIIDDTMDDAGGEMGSAITALSEHASVLPFSRRVDWHQELVA